MATVIENNPPAEREVIREPVDNTTYTTTGSSGGTALTVLIVLIVAVLAVGAFMLYMRSPGTVTPHHAAATVERSVNDVGDAAGDAAGTVKRSVTTTTNTQ